MLDERCGEQAIRRYPTFCKGPNQRSSSVLKNQTNPNSSFDANDPAGEVKFHPTLWISSSLLRSREYIPSACRSVKSTTSGHDTFHPLCH